jgi:hypothetical protein
MLLDCHTHVFPPEVLAQRETHLAADAAFAALYSDPKAKLATTEDLLAGMDAAGIGVSLALGFAWSDPQTCRLHNDFLLESAQRGKGRIIAFCTLPLAASDAVIEAEARRCVAAGARGFGELRPDDLDFDIGGERGRRLGALARELDAVLLFHASEPVGHAYPGKRGLAVDDLYAFICANPGTKIIAAHWGGGLPFYALMPEVRLALADVYFDTAATSLLYDAAIYATVSQLVGPDHLLFGSDFPLIPQSRARRQLEAAVPEAATRELILGANAARLLGLQ